MKQKTKILQCDVCKGMFEIPSEAKPLGFNKMIMCSDKCVATAKAYRARRRALAEA